MRQLYKAYPHFKSLNSVSKIMLKFFVQAYPTWIAYASIDSEYNGLVLTIPSRHSPDERELTIHIEGWRITVYFDLHHAHFYWREGQTDSQIFVDVQAYIEDIMHERRIAAVKLNYQGTPYSAAASLTPEMLSTLEPGEYTYTRSWLGTYDKSFED